MAEGGESVNFENLTGIEETETSDMTDMSMAAVEPDTTPMTLEAGDEDVNLQRFLQKSKCDRMYELRQLQHGEKPVTGQEHKENIDKFFSKRIQAREQAASSGKENVPVNEVSVEEVRPETVVVEIQGLVEQHRVSNVLSTAFRRRLENIIRGSISTVTRNYSPRPSASPSPSPHGTTPSPVPTPQRNNTPPPPASPPHIPVVNRLQDETIRGRTNSTASSDTGSTVSSNVSSSHEQAAANHPTEQQPLMQQHENRNITITDADELQRETFIQEISELVHRQLVTSTLQSNFRSTLEVQMRDRLEQSGTDGQRVQEFVQSIQPSQIIPRNDFSHIGLPAPGADNWDNISVTSVSTHAVPYTQSNLYLTREMQSLKAQIEEMKSMLRVSFDLQLDIQRAIRQEVAAAMSESKGSSTSSNTRSHSKPVNDTHCLICLDKYADSVLYQCGHMCLCYSCGRHLISRGSNCPVCRAPIKDIIRAYKSSED